MKRVVLTFGLIAGAALSAMMVATAPFMDQIGFDYGAVVGYTSMVLGFLLVYFGIRSYRDNVGGGAITFGRGTAIGLSIVAIASVCYVATWEVVSHTMLKDFAERYAAHAMDAARRAGATAAELAKQEQDLAAFKTMYANPIARYALTFVEPLPVGILMTLVSAGVLRRGQRREVAA
jgi:hypothetical protein